MADQAGAENERTGLSFRSRTRTSTAPVRATAFSVFEHLFIIFSVAVFIGVSTLGKTVQSASIGTTQHNTLNTVLYCVVLAIGFVLVLQRRREIVPILVDNKVIWFFMVWAVASVAWSIDPTLTARRLFQLAAPVLIALFAAVRFNPTTTIKLTGWCCFGIIVASAIVTVLWPHLGVMTDNLDSPDLVEGSALAGDWKGILDHKNSLGFVTLESAQIFMWRWLVEKERRWLYGAILLFGAFVCYKSHSTTSALLMGFSAVVFIGVRMSAALARLRGLIAFAAVVLAVAAILAGTLMREEMTALVGKDATLTGRLPIWEALIEHAIPARPVLGYGFNAFFSLDNPEYLRLVQIVQWPAPHAHNGYLNLAVELGIPGMLLGIYILLRMIARALRRLHDPNAPWAEYMFVFGVVMIVLSCVEATLLRLGDELTFILMFCSFAFSKHVADLRATVPPVMGRAGVFRFHNRTEGP